MTTKQKIDHDHWLCKREDLIRGRKCECPCEMCREMNGPLERPLYDNVPIRDAAERAA